MTYPARKQTIQRLMLSKGAKRTKFYHIAVILQYCLDKTIASSWDMYRDDLGILSLVIKCFSITNTSLQHFAIRIPSAKTVPKCFAETKRFLNNFNIDVSFLLMSSLRAIVICQKIFRKSCDITSNPSLRPLLNMRRYTLWKSPSESHIALRTKHSEKRIAPAYRISCYYLLLNKKAIRKRILPERKTIEIVTSPTKRGAKLNNLTPIPNPRQTGANLSKNNFKETSINNFFPLKSYYWIWYCKRESYDLNNLQRILSQTTGANYAFIIMHIHHWL